MEMKQPVVRVYRNLHIKGVCYSLQARGRVMGHQDNILLKNPKFVVQKAGQQKVRQTKNKVVHAFVDGTIITDPNEMVKAVSKIKNTKETAYYNPYTVDTFVDKDGNELKEAQLVLLTHHDGKSKLMIVK